MANKIDPDLLEALITELLDKIPLEDKVNIANLSEGQIHAFESILGKHIRLRYMWLSREEVLDDEDEAKAILKEVWQRLRETHRGRVVKCKLQPKPT